MTEHQKNDKIGKIHIILYLLLNGKSTSTQIAKSLFNVSFEDRRRYSTANRVVRYYLDKLIDEGLVVKENADVTTYYSLAEDKVFLSEDVKLVFHDMVEDKVKSIEFGKPTLIAVAKDGLYLEPVEIEFEEEIEGVVENGDTL